MLVQSFFFIVLRRRNARRDFAANYNGTSNQVQTMRTLVDHIVANRIGALLILLLAAFLEAYGDSSFQAALYRSSGTRKVIAFLAGAACLAAYGLVVNTPRWDFGKLLGIYVVFFFLVAQGINWARFGQSPTLPVVMGGSLIVAGGVIIAAFAK